MENIWSSLMECDSRSGNPSSGGAKGEQVVARRYEKVRGGTEEEQTAGAGHGREG